MIEQSSVDDTHGTTRRRLLIEEISSDEDCQRKPPAKKKAKSEVETDPDCAMSDQATCGSDERFYEHLPVPASSPSFSLTAGQVSSPDATVSPGGLPSAIQFALSSLAVRRGQEQQQLDSSGVRRRGQYADFRIYEDPFTPGAIDSGHEDGSTVPLTASSSSSSLSDEKENVMETDTEDGELEPHPGTGIHATGPHGEGRVLHTGAHESRIVLGMYEGPRFPAALRELLVPGPSDFNGRNQQYRDPQHESEDGDDEEEETDRYDTGEQDQQEHSPGEQEIGRHFSIDDHWLGTHLRNNNNNERRETPSAAMRVFSRPISVIIEGLEHHTNNTTTASVDSPLFLSAVGWSATHQHGSMPLVQQMYSNTGGHVAPYGNNNAMTHAFTSPSAVTVPAHTYDHRNGHNNNNDGDSSLIHNNSSSPIHGIHHGYPWSLTQPTSLQPTNPPPQNNTHA
jgi:hypothetical protein